MLEEKRKERTKERSTSPFPETDQEISRKPSKPTKSKEELAEIRKQMMKRRPVIAKNGDGGIFAASADADAKQPAKKQKDHPKAALMSRLASGTRVEVSKKEMLKLTNKNYENLPEVRKKREEESKKEDLRKR